MRIFLFILTNNLIPIFALIIIGVLIDKKFHLDISTLTKINLYIYVPAFVFANVYTTEMPLDMLKALAVVILILLINWTVGYVIGKIRGMDRSLASAFTNSLMFYNSGNFGIPLITLVFSGGKFLINGETPYLDFALTVQVIVLIIQNMTTNTIGVFNASHASCNFAGALKKALKMPALYFIVAAFLLKLIPYDFTQFPLWPAFNYAKNGLVSIALLSLGVQLSKTKLQLKNLDVCISVLCRLIGGPVIALLLVLLFGIDGIMAQVLIISSGVPTAANTALIGVEFKNHPDFASQAVMISTILSSITLSGVIYLAGILFPV